MENLIRPAQRLVRLSLLSVFALLFYSSSAYANDFSFVTLLQNENLVSIVISVFAFIGSAFSFYMTVLRGAKIKGYVSPVVQFQSFQRTGGGFTEYFNVPLTVMNGGAKSAIIQSITLEVMNPHLKQSRFYYPQASGSFIDSANGREAPFTPVAVAGRESKSLQLIFDRKPGQEDSPEQIAQDIRHVDVEGGTFGFRLYLHVISGGKVKTQTLTFNMLIERLDYRRFGGGGSMPMYDVNFAKQPGGMAAVTV
ncbi:MAG: hypothetical protein ACRBBN_16790 [Methyloligellaceae bacterium]